MEIRDRRRWLYSAQFNFKGSKMYSINFMASFRGSPVPLCRIRSDAKGPPFSET